MPMSHLPSWPGPPSTVQPDEGPLSELSKRERHRMRRAMIRGRPLPPRLARAAVQYAPELHSQAWLGWFLLVMSLLYALVGAGQALWGGHGWWLFAGWEVLAVIALAASRQWFRAARRAGQAARDGLWPELPGDEG